jgi:hypothetical protein
VRIVKIWQDSDATFSANSFPHTLNLIVSSLDPKYFYRPIELLECEVLWPWTLMVIHLQYVFHQLYYKYQIKIYNEE